MPFTEIDGRIKEIAVTFTDPSSADKRWRLVFALDSLHDVAVRLVDRESNVNDVLADAERVIRAVQAAILNGAMDADTVRKLQLEFVPEMTRWLARWAGVKR